MTRDQIDWNEWLVTSTYVEGKIKRLQGPVRNQPTSHFIGAKLADRPFMSVEAHEDFPLKYGDRLTFVKDGRVTEVVRVGNSHNRTEEDKLAKRQVYDAHKYVYSFAPAYSDGVQ